MTAQSIMDFTPPKPKKKKKEDQPSLFSVQKAKKQEQASLIPSTPPVPSEPPTPPLPQGSPMQSVSPGPEYFEEPLAQQEKQKPLTVQQYIDQFNIEFRHRPVGIEGELQEVRTSRSAWVFFQIKDEDNESVLRCFAVRARIGRIHLEDGMKVVIKGYAKLHEKYGLSLTVEYIELHGEGALQKAFEEQRRRLEQEGVFALEHKQQLQEVPQRIALIASTESAAYTDFIKVINARRQGLIITPIHTTVQGKAAIPEIVTAVQKANNAQQQFDAIVITRGGGSIEDLQAFNAEEVVRTIFASKTPVICAIGHERDTTLAELAADVRASTPSNAAELVSLSAEEILSRTRQQIQRIQYKIQNTIQEKQQQHTTAVHKMRAVFVRQQQYVRQVAQRIRTRVRQVIEQQQQKQETQQRNIKHIKQQLQQAVTQQQRNLKHITQILTANAPTSILKKGYSIAKDSKGKIITSTKQLKKGQKVTTQLNDGSYTAEVASITK